MTDVWLSVFRLKGAISKHVHVNIHISPYPLRYIAFSLSIAWPHVWRWALLDRREERRRRFPNVSLASVSPWPLPGGAMWAGKRHGGGRCQPWSRRLTIRVKPRWEEKIACVWEGFYYWDVRGGCQWRRTCAHVNRTEGGVRPQAKTASSQQCVKSNMIFTCVRGSRELRPQHPLLFSSLFLLFTDDAIVSPDVRQKFYCSV